jgi:hypothetical protein
MRKAAKVSPPRPRKPAKVPPPPRGDERRNLVLEAAQAYEHGFPEIRPDGLPRQQEQRDERDGFEVLVVLRLTDDDEVVVDRLMVGDNRPVRGQPHATPSELSRVLGSLPLARWRDEALRGWASSALREAAPGVWSGPAPEAVERARRRLGGKVEQAARIYAEHESHAPTRAVAEQLGIPYETARSRIKAARERGLLPGAPGRGRRSRPQQES